MNHDDHEQSSKVSNALTALAIGGAVVGGAVMLAPHVLPALGYGSPELASYSLNMLHESSGIAGGINEMLGAVPFIGSRLAEGGFFNAITTGIIGVGGVMLGDLVGQDKDNKTAVNIGKAIRYGALATSALIALPTVLTAIGAGIIFLSTLGGDAVMSSGIVEMVNNSIGSMAGGEHPMMGMSGLAAAVPHLLTCGTVLLPSALSLKLWKDDQAETLTALENKKPYSFIAKDTKGNALPFTDPNHFMTPDEFALVEEYNSAKPAKKILLKKQILAQGYLPDFHDDGTVHLYSHGGAHASMSR